MKDKYNPIKEKNTFLNFPDRVSNSRLFLIIILGLIIVFSLGLLLFSGKTYGYLPSYEEKIFSEDINPAFFVLSDYSNSNDKIKKNNRIVYSLKKNMKNDSTYNISNIRANLIGVLENGDYEYLSEYKSLDTLAKYPPTHNFASLTSGSSLDYKKIINKVVYDYALGNNVPQTKVLTFEEEILTTSKEEYNQKYSENSIGNNKEIFSTHKITQTADTVSNKVQVELNLYYNIPAKYHIDYQLFGIDENDNVYTLIGIYNLSTLDDLTYTKSVSLSKDLKLKTLFAKCKYINIEGTETYYYSKEPFEL